MKKKILLLALMITVFACFLSISVLAETPSEGRLGINTIIEGISEPTVIDTTSQIEMDDGKIYPSYYFFKDQTSTAWDFTKVTKEDGTNYTIDNIVKLEIPHGITKLASLGYRDKKKTTLSHVRIPNTITDNDSNGGFRSTSSLSSIEFEEGYSYKIFESMFYGCPDTDFVIPEGVTSIDKESMCNMGLITITIPDNVTYIGSSAFTGNSKLTMVNIGENSKLKTIGYRAFAGLGALTSTIYLPSTIEEIGEGAFSSSYNIAEFKNIENTKITVVNKNAFYECKKITSIILPSTVTSIGDNAFISCSMLKSITIPEGVTTMGNRIFQSSGLEHIVIPDTVTSFGTDMFNNCKSLKTAKLSNALTYVPLYTFYGCSALESFYMSDNVTYVGQYAFFNCSSLGPVYLSKNIETIYSNGTYGQGAFQNCGKMYFVNSPQDTKKPDVYVLPSTLTSLGKATLKNCMSLNTTLVFPANMKNLDEDGWSFGNRGQSTTRNFVFLGEFTELRFANENYNTNFYYVNPNMKAENIEIKFSYDGTSIPTNCYVFVCSEGKSIKLDGASDWTEDGYSHIVNPSLTYQTEPDCVTGILEITYCYCGAKIGETELENSALGHEYDVEKGAIKTVIEYASYLAKGNLKIKCARCDEHSDNEVAPIIKEFKGISIKEKGNGLTFGYVINYDALDEYVEVNKTSVSLGFVVAVQAFLGGNQPLTESGEKAGDKVVKLEIYNSSTYADEGFRYTGVDFKLMGNWNKTVDLDGDGKAETDIKDVVFYMAGYIIDGDTASFINYGATGKTSDAFSYNQF